MSTGTIRWFSVFQKHVLLAMLVEINSQGYLIQDCCPATCFSSANITKYLNITF